MAQRMKPLQLNRLEFPGGGIGADPGPASARSAIDVERGTGDRGDLFSLVLDKRRQNIAGENLHIQSVEDRHCHRKHLLHVVQFRTVGEGDYIDAK